MDFGESYPENKEMKQKLYYDEIIVDDKKIIINITSTEQYYDDWCKFHEYATIEVKFSDGEIIIFDIFECYKNKINFYSDLNNNVEPSWVQCLRLPCNDYDYKEIYKATIHFAKNFYKFKPYLIHQFKYITDQNRTFLLMQKFGRLYFNKIMIEYGKEKKRKQVISFLINMKKNEIRISNEDALKLFN